MMSFSNNDLILGLGGLCLLGLLILGYFLISIRSQENALRKKREFFSEMQSILRTTLLPLDFEEKGGAEGGDKEGNYKSTIYYLRGKTLVHLRMDTANSLYSLGATRKLAYGDDFLIEGNMDEAEKFKSDSIAKLNEWIIRESIQ
jgi:hypothetical protein